MRIHCTLIGRENKQNKKQKMWSTLKVGKDAEQIGLSYIANESAK